MYSSAPYNPDPGQVHPPFRLYTLGQMLRESLRIYSQNATAFVGIAAAVSVPLLLLLIPVTLQYQRDSVVMLINPNAIPASTGLLLAANALSTLLSAVIVGALVTSITSEAVYGERLAPLDAWRAAQPRLLPLGAALLILAFGLSAGLVVSLLTALCFIGLVVLGLVIYAAVSVYMLLTPVMVLERVTLRAGLLRAFALGRARFWRGVSLLMSLTLLTALLDLIAAELSRPLLDPLLRADSLDLYYTLRLVLSTAMTIVTAPFIAAVLTLFYYDLRVRVEGFDEAAARVEADAVPRPREIPAPLPQPPYLDQRDLVNGFAVVGGLLLISIVLDSTLGGVMDGLLFGL